LDDTQKNDDGPVSLKEKYIIIVALLKILALIALPWLAYFYSGPLGVFIAGLLSNFLYFRIFAPKRLNLFLILIVSTAVFLFLIRLLEALLSLR
jgi:hypothetical protein